MHGVDFLDINPPNLIIRQIALPFEDGAKDKPIETMLACA